MWRKLLKLSRIDDAIDDFWEALSVKQFTTCFASTMFAVRMKINPHKKDFKVQKTEQTKPAISNHEALILEEQLCYAVSVDHIYKTKEPITTFLLARCNEPPSLLCVRLPTASECIGTHLFFVALHASFKLWSEMSNKTLQWPSESLAESLWKSVEVIHQDSKEDLTAD